MARPNCKGLHTLTKMRYASEKCVASLNLSRHVTAPATCAAERLKEVLSYAARRTRPTAGDAEQLADDAAPRAVAGGRAAQGDDRARSRFLRAPGGLVLRPGR